MNEYEKQAQEFLRKTGCDLTIEYVGDVEGFPFSDKDHMMHRSYECRLERYLTEPMTWEVYEFPFYGSYNDWRTHTDPTEYDVLACLDTYCPDTIDEFFDEFGYEVRTWEDVRRIQRTYAAVKKEQKQLRRMFSDDELDMLAEIN